MIAQTLFYDTVLPLMGESTDSGQIYLPRFLPILNVILWDTLALNNSWRKKCDKEELESPPVILSITQDIPYEEGLLVNVLSYGIAARLTIDDGEPAKTTYFEENYATRYNAGAGVFYTPLEDVWEGDDL